MSIAELLARRSSFTGGIHPPDNKVTKNKAIQPIVPTEKVIVPLSQHIGAPAEPIAEKGDEVKRGQKIGEANGFVSSPVHAPTSGTVSKIADFPHPSGTPAKGIQIDFDGEDQSVEFTASKSDGLSGEEIIQKIQQAGIVGMGGAAFPTHVKLSPPEDKNVDTLIINGAECEPYLTADYRLMMEEPEKIVKGVELIARGLGVDTVIYGIEDNKTEAAERIDQSTDSQVEVVQLPTKYPQGWEKTLIHALTGRQVPVGGLPLDIGVVVQNVGTAKAVWDALRYGRPLTERVVTVTGTVKNPGNYSIRIGTTWKDILDQLGGLKESKDGQVKLIDGGPMMGNTQSSWEVPVLKSTSGMLVLDEAVAIHREPRACIGCGKCIDACPANLLPTSIYKSIEAGDIEKARELNATACCECGSCTYVCPSEIPLTQWIVQAKNEITLEDREEED